jgi:hypothetical protein
MPMRAPPDERRRRPLAKGAARSSLTSSTRNSLPHGRSGVVVELATERLRRRSPWPWEWQVAPTCEGTCRCYGQPLGGFDPSRWAR